LGGDFSRTGQELYGRFTDGKRAHRTFIMGETKKSQVGGPFIWRGVKKGSQKFKDHGQGLITAKVSTGKGVNR